MLNKLPNGMPSPQYTVVTADVDGVERTDIFTEWWNDGKQVEPIHKTIDDAMYGESFYDKGYYKIISCTLIKPEPMKLIVAGGRDFTDIDCMHKILEEMDKEDLIDSDVQLVCGMAKGADLMAKDIFDANGLIVLEYPADWNDMSEPCVRKTNRHGAYNALAGMKRNHAMGDEANILLAFWNGKSKGTKDMIDYMLKLNKSVYVIDY